MARSAEPYQASLARVTPVVRSSIAYFSTQGAVSDDTRGADDAGEPEEEFATVRPEVRDQPPKG